MMSNAATDPSTEKPSRRDAVTGHPLELIPFFRRWPPSTVRDLVYTFVLGMAFAVAFTSFDVYLLPPKKALIAFAHTTVISQCISFSVHIIFSLGEFLFGEWMVGTKRWWHNVYYLVAPLVGIYIGYWIGFGLLDMPAARAAVFSAKGGLAVGLVSVAVTTILFFAYFARGRRVRQEAALAAEQRRAIDAERRALEAQLRMLQAQIEPHFLYNTLANAVGLIQPAPDRARLLLERLIEYLRASLTASRDTSATLANEIATMTAYLELMKVRMGDRLRYRVYLPATLGQYPLPPMLLQPLVENAITHGLEPKIAGGEITVHCEADTQSLTVTIADDGVGFDPSAKPRAGGGVGLSNLRERITVLYGDSGRLTVSDNTPVGVRVSLRIPLAQGGGLAPI